MTFGLGVLGLPPRDFWALTPRELAAIVKGRMGLSGQPTPPTRADFAELMLQFPDNLLKDNAQ